MKISAFFENGDAGREKAVRQTAWIREKYPSDTLVMISAGDFRSDGIAFGVRARDRAGYQMEAGADVILSLPAASVLGGFGKKNFASAALIQRLHAVDRILLLCHPLPGQSVDECAKELKACAMAVFREGTVYRSRLQEALLQKLSFHEAQMRAVICCMPQAEKLLAYSENRKTVRILDTLLQLYYMVETEFLDVREISGKETEAGSSDGWLPERKAFETKAAEELKKTLSRKTSASLRDIAGWTDGMIEALYPEPEWLRKADSLQEIAEKLAAYTMNTDSARLFLLRTILMITQSNMQINALHLYVPYTYVLGIDRGKDTELHKFREVSWVHWGWILKRKRSWEKSGKRPGFLLSVPEKPIRPCRSNIHSFFRSIKEPISSCHEFHNVNRRVRPGIELHSVSGRALLFFMHQVQDCQETRLYREVRLRW